VSSVVFSISGHAFGHASREVELVNALAPLVPDHAIVIRTSAPRWLFDRTVRVPFIWLGGPCDAGIVQIGSLRLNERATISQAAQSYHDLPRRVDEEAALLRSHRARLVIANVRLDLRGLRGTARGRTRSDSVDPGRVPRRRGGVAAADAWRLRDVRPYHRHSVHRATCPARRRHRPRGAGASG
jgi:hypothetical protein